MNHDERTVAPGARKRRAVGRRPVGLLAGVLAGSLLAAAACGGGSSSSGQAEGTPATTMAAASASRSGSTDDAASTPGSGARPDFAAFRQCMEAEGVTLPDPSAGPPSSFPAPSPALASAFRKCRDKMPRGAMSGPGMQQFAAYMNCIMDNGVAMDHSGNTPMTPPDFDDPTFKKADQACANLRPKMPAAPGTSR